MSGADLGFITFISFLTVAMWGPVLGEFWPKRAVKAGFFCHLFLAATLWLWGPWLAYGVKTLYLWNLGKINDLAPEEKVLPPAPRERSSAADLEKP